MVRDLTVLLNNSKSRTPSAVLELVFGLLYWNPLELHPLPDIDCTISTWYRTSIQQIDQVTQASSFNTCHVVLLLQNQSLIDRLMKSRPKRSKYFPTKLHIVEGSHMIYACKAKYDPSMNNQIGQKLLCSIFRWHCLFHWWNKITFANCCDIHLRTIFNQLHTNWNNKYSYEIDWCVSLLLRSFLGFEASPCWAAKASPKGR